MTNTITLRTSVTSKGEPAMRFYFAEKPASTTGFKSVMHFASDKANGYKDAHWFAVGEDITKAYKLLKDKGFKFKASSKAEEAKVKALLKGETPKAETPKAETPEEKVYTLTETQLEAIIKNAIASALGK